MLGSKHGSRLVAATMLVHAASSGEPETTMLAAAQKNDA
jgi:hypothetical protein